MKKQLFSLESIITLLKAQLFLFPENTQDVFKDTVHRLEREQLREETFYESKYLVHNTATILVPEGAINLHDFLPGPGVRCFDSIKVRNPYASFKDYQHKLPKNVEGRNFIVSPYVFNKVTITDLIHRSVDEFIYMPSKNEALYILLYLWKLDAVTRFYFCKRKTVIPFQDKEGTGDYGYWHLESFEDAAQRNLQTLYLFLDIQDSFDEYSTCFLINKKAQLPSFLK